MQKPIYGKCEKCGLIHFVQERACPRCGYEGASGEANRGDVGFSEALEYAYAIAPDSLFNYSLCLSLIADFAPHIKQDWKILLRTAFDCGAIDEFCAQGGLVKDPYERAANKLTRFLRDNDRDFVLFAYMKCLHPEMALLHSSVQQDASEGKKEIMSDLVNCLVQVINLKRLETSGVLQDQISSLEYQLRMLKKYSLNTRSGPFTT